ncbi:MAG: SPOR domain-containing protein [Leptolyngbya sp. IPPAS B-1204]|nr:SPOR domain-containing protein [Elainella sp. C42_A2020_010]RNJ69713.1 MAG: hypothetical protein EDM05_07500 [Leptolyngbya sp. IPPAS B-1204]
MRQPSSIEPFTPSPTVVLHPALQAALENLDVQIEEELIRYRRQRRHPATTVPRRKPFPATSSGAAAIGILNHSIQLPTPRSSIYGSSYGSSTYDSHNSYDSQATRQVGPSQVGQSAAQINPPPPTPPVHPVHQTAHQTVHQTAVSRPQPPEMAVPTASPAPVTFAADPRANRAADEAATARIASYAEQHDLSAYTPSSTLQKFVQQPVSYSTSDASNAPDDYLASSEELLRSIGEADPDQPSDPNTHSLLNTLLTPMGIGSMLLLVLASTTLGYVIMNPGSLGLWTPDANPDSSANSSTSPAATAGGAAPSPDLTSDEFVDLDLGTLSTLPKQTSRSGAQTEKSTKSTQSQSAKSNASTAKPSTPAVSSPTQAAASAPPEIPVAPAPQPSLSTVVVPAAPPVMSVPEPAIPAPVPEPAPVSPEPISTVPPPIEPAPAAEPAPSVAAASTDPIAPTAATTPPAQNNYYYVVTEYSGDASLQQARSAVPDAYVRNLPDEGAKVQLGAFNDETKAQELLQQLQQQGIEAQVYQP